MKFKLIEIMLLYNQRPHTDTIEKMMTANVRREQLEEALAEGRWELC